MINTFFKQLQEHLKTDLPWLETVGRNVSYLQGKDGLIPVSCIDDECKGSTTALVPVSGKSNILFFDFRNSSKSLNDPCISSNKVEFDIFFWFDCTKLDVVVDGLEIECCEKLDFLYNSIEKSLQSLGIFTIFGTSYNIDAPFLTEKMRYYPYFNFKLRVGTTITFDECSYNNVDIQIKQC